MNLQKDWYFRVRNSAYLRDDMDALEEAKDKLKDPENMYYAGIVVSTFCVLTTFVIPCLTMCIIDAFFILGTIGMKQSLSNDMSKNQKELEKVLTNILAKVAKNDYLEAYQKGTLKKLNDIREVPFIHDMSDDLKEEYIRIYNNIVDNNGSYIE